MNSSHSLFDAMSHDFCQKKLSQITAAAWEPVTVDHFLCLRLNISVQCWRG